MRSIIAALLALAVLVCGAASASAGSAPAGGRPDWRMGMRFAGTPATFLRRAARKPS